MKLLGVVIALCLLASGCSDAEDSLPREDQEFLDALVEAQVLDADADEATLADAIERGHAWCDRLSDPDTTREDVARSLARLLRESEAQESQRATIFFGTAAKTYCPEAADRLRG
ncbi:hypothetical protein BH18ACT9_BH18ACT9_21910 [soil metagenome]